MSRNLFFTVMEADGDELQPFDGALAVEDTPTDAPQSATNDLGNEPPEMNENDQQLQSFDGSSGEPNYDDGGDGVTDEDQTEPSNGESTKLSEKANNILNQRLYQKMIDRNNEIQELIDDIQKLTPLIPYDAVQSNDASLNRLKSALSEGQKYVINRFVDSKYGENLMFYQKLDTLYVLLLNSIDNNLKKIKK